MTKSIALIAAGLMTAVATPALAQDAEGTFTGFRVQADVGYDSLGAGSTTDDDANVDNDQSMEGISYGVTAGYDFDLGGAVVGLEASYADSTAKVEFDEGDFEGFGFGRVSADRDLYIGARAGAKIAPDALLYAKGGYAMTRLDVLSSDGTTERQQDVDFDGWRLGAGVEYAINRNTFFNVEYRYTNYTDAEVDYDGTIPDADIVGVDLDRHQVVASVGMRF